MKKPKGEPICFCAAICDRADCLTDFSPVELQNHLLRLRTALKVLHREFAAVNRKIAELRKRN